MGNKVIIMFENGKTAMCEFKSFERKDDEIIFTGNSGDFNVNFTKVCYMDFIKFK